MCTWLVLFCYICGSHTVAKHRKKISAFMKHVYLAYILGIRQSMTPHNNTWQICLEAEVLQEAISALWNAYDTWGSVYVGPRIYRLMFVNLGTR